MQIKWIQLRNHSVKRAPGSARRSSSNYISAAHTAPSPSPLLYSMPREVLSQVFLLLDLFSLRALLEVCPPLRRYFILFTDVSPKNSRLYLSGIQTLDIEETMTFHGWRTKMIFLYEFGDPHRSRPEPIWRDESPMLTMDVYNKIAHQLKRDSFVYVRHLPLYSMKNYARWAKMLFDAKCSAVFEHFDGVEKPEALVKEHTISFVVGMSFSPNLAKYHTNTISRLEFDCVSAVLKATFPRLTELTLHFKGKNPKFHNFSATNVTYLRIFYEHGFPHLSGLVIGSSDIRRSIDLKATTRSFSDRVADHLQSPVLVIAQEAATSHHIQHQLPRCPTSPSKVNAMDFGFAKNFKFVCVYGGNDIVLEKVCHAEILKLHWKQTNLQWHGEEWSDPLRLTKLTSVVLESFIEQPTVPLFSGAMPTVIGLLSYKSGLDIRAFWQQMSCLRLRYLQVYCLSKRDSDTIDIPAKVLHTIDRVLWMLELEGCTIDPQFPRDEKTSKLAWVSLKNMKGRYKDVDNSPEFREKVSTLPADKIQYDRH